MWPLQVQQTSPWMHGKFRFFSHSITLGLRGLGGIASSLLNIISLRATMLTILSSLFSEFIKQYLECSIQKFISWWVLPWAPYTTISTPCLSLSRRERISISLFYLTVVVKKQKHILDSSEIIWRLCEAYLLLPTPCL